MVQFQYSLFQSRINGLASDQINSVDLVGLVLACNNSMFDRNGLKLASIVYFLCHLSGNSIEVTVC
jgi:hypothetical protein